MRTADCAGLPTERFDRILLDAPCSGLGVLNRHPEARWNRDAGIVSRMANLQARLLRAASGRLRIGGRLLYVTCSVEPEENEAHFERIPDGFELADLSGHLPDGLPYLETPASGIRILPHAHGDGFTVHALRRRG